METLAEIKNEMEMRLSIIHALNTASVPLSIYDIDRATGNQYNRCDIANYLEKLIEMGLASASNAMYPKYIIKRG